MVSCPCALVISIPLSFFAGIGNASKKGILFKGSNYLEALSKIETIIFDKTGTLTQGQFAVQEIVAQNIDKVDVLRITAHLESFSNHPIAKAIVKCYGQNIDQNSVSEVQEISGKGLSGIFNNQTVLVGNARLMKDSGISIPNVDSVGTIIFVAIDDIYQGHIIIADNIKKDSAQTLEQLKKHYVKKTVMLTGDNEKIANHIAGQIMIDESYSGLLPQDKVKKLEKLLETKSNKGKVVFVGDGINDSPVLAQADIGIAMGKNGADIAIETADIVLMTDEPSKIIDAIKISKKTLSIAKQNIIFSLIIKFGVLILSAFGFESMWLAVFADVGVSIIAILNALRVLKMK